MSTNKTPMLGLHKWVSSDPIKRSEFNENFQKIDAAVTAKARISTGSYVGTGGYGASSPCSLTFEFPPKLVFIQKGGDSFYDHYSDFFVYGAGTSTSLAASNQSWAMCNKVVWSGNTVTWHQFESSGSYSPSARQQLNEKGVTYYYAAIG